MKKVGVKLSIVSIASIVSTQVAPFLHHLHKKEGKLDTYLIEYLSVFCREYNFQIDLKKKTSAFFGGLLISISQSLF